MQTFLDRLPPNHPLTRSKPGEPGFDEALEALASAHLYKGAGAAGAKTMLKSEYDALPLRQQAWLMASKERPMLVDDETPLAKEGK
jgi:hypothetical protein